MAVAISSAARLGAGMPARAAPRAPRAVGHGAQAPRVAQAMRMRRFVAPLRGAPCRAGSDSYDEFQSFDEEDWDDMIDGESTANLDGMDYYSILGVSIDSTPKDIKKAYYRNVKVCHPDLIGDSEASNDLCGLLNEIYEVLSDPVKRATYDAIAGFAAGGTNPFLVEQGPRDKVFVDEFTCIGCKMCANVASSTGRSRVIEQGQDTEALVTEAIETCPVDCIHWVTNDQLTLLEEEMANMERVAVGIMMARQGARGDDVFMSASVRWDKRQSNLRDRAERNVKAQKRKDSKFGQGIGFWGSGFASTSRGQPSWDSMDEGAGQEDVFDDDMLRSRSNISAKAAQQARRWRDFQRVRREAAENREAIGSLPSGDS